MTPAPDRDLLKITLAVTFIGVLTLASLWILEPFLPALVWATMIVVTTWPLLLRVQRLLRGRRGPAVTVMTAVMLTVFVVPMAAATFTLGATQPRALVPPAPRQLPARR